MLESEDSLQMQAVIIRRCLLVGVAFVTGFGISNLTHGFHLLGWTELGMTLTLGFAVWWSYHGASLFSLRSITTAHAGLLFFIMFFHGGSSGLGYMWVLGFPFVTCFMLGSRIGLVWTAFYAAAITIYWIAGWPESGYLDFAWREMAYMGVVYLAFTLVAYFTTILRERGEKLEREALIQLKSEADALAESEARYKTLLDTSPNAVGVNRDGKWVYVNPAAAKLFAAKDADEIIGTPILNYVYPDYHAMVVERMQSQQEHNTSLPVVEMKLARLNAEVFTAEVQSSPVVFEGEASFLVTCVDISERKRYEEERLSLQSQLEHAQRLESLGVLAGGIAHDFNNLLAAILGNVELLKMEVKESEKTGRHFSNVVESCDQAAKLSKQMLAYAGKGNYLLEVLNINKMVRSMSRLIKASVSSHIELRVKLDSGLPCVEGDAAQIQQVILNFIVNGAEAIGEKSGEIKLTTRTVHAKRDFLDTLYNGIHLPEGEYVVIEVKDSGCGIAKDLQSKVFEPFFTTKEMGTGLGLSALLGIVRAHKGAVQLVSELGHGAAFSILIPSTDKPAATRGVDTSEVERWQGEGTVLVVDDDPTVREVASAIVTGFHFEVLTANDGREGVNTFRKHHRKITAVLLDMTMPQLGGIDAMREMREIDASVPIILVSGYSEVSIRSLSSGEQPDAFVQKPFKAKELKKGLYRVLSEPKEA